MDNNEQIVALLKEQVVKETLSLKGIEQVQDILSENERLTKEVKLLKDSNMSEEKRNNSLLKDNQSLILDKDSLEAKVKDYEAREKEFYEQSIEFKYEKQRGSELKEIVSMALRNPIITRTRNEFGSENVTDTNGYTMSMPTNNNMTEEETIK